MVKKHRVIMRSSCTVIQIRTKTEIETQETTNVGKSAFENTVSQKTASHGA